MITLQSEPQDKQKNLEQGFELYRQSFWISLPFSLLSVVFIFAPSVFAPFTPYQAWVILFCWVVGYILMGALIFRLYCFCYQVPSNFWLSLKHALSKLIPLLLLIAVYSLIILSATMILIIPGIILSVSLMFAFILAITDNQNVLQTLLSSHRLVWGHWWSTSMIISIPLLINLVLSLIIFSTGLVLYRTLELSLTNTIWFIFVSSAIIQALLIPLVFCVALVLLHDLRRRQTMLQPPWSI